MRTNPLIPFFLAALLTSASTAYAGESMGHSVRASQHGSKALAHSVAGTAKLTSGVVAVPLMAAGEIGKAVGSAGDELWEEANTPLPITDEIITVGPPPSVPSDKKAVLQPQSSEKGK